MPKNTRLSGHTLRSEGHPYIRDGVTGGWCRNRSSWDGVGLCSCGATSEGLPTNGARKRWHADHKEEIRAKLVDSSKEG